jgi:hypothetical protein
MLALVLAAPLLAADVAFADCALFLPLEIFAFADQRVPVNAELRVIGVRDSIDLTFPDGVTRTTAIVVDELGARVDLATPLAVGTYTFQLDEDSAPVSFVVEDVVDDLAPDAPTVATRQSTRVIPPDLLGIGDDCVDPGISDAVTFDVDGVTAGDLVMIDGTVGGVALTTGRVIVGRGEARGGAVRYEVALRDMAGNESEPTTVEVWSGCPGGCASTGALPLCWVLLFFLKRRAASREETSR